MNIIKWFKNRREGLLAVEQVRKADRQADIGSRRVTLEKRIDDETAAMCKKYCAIRDDVCTNECIHFKHGSLGFHQFGEDDLDYYHYTIMPKCLLQK